MSALSEKTLGFSSRREFDREIKFTLDGRDVTAAHKWLQTICIPDPGFPTGLVYSIYYDTPALDCLREKIDSDYLKIKIRLRWYEGQNNSVNSSFLEAKFRIGQRRHKVRIETPYSGDWLTRTPLHHSTLRQIPLRLREEGISVPSLIRPVLLVRYRRNRFIETLTNLRVCLDSNISAPIVNREVLLAPNPIQLSTAVVEVKGNVVGLPQMLRNLIDLGGRKTSFSKYFACYDHTVTIAN